DRDLALQTPDRGPGTRPGPGSPAHDRGTGRARLRLSRRGPDGVRRPAVRANVHRVHPCAGCGPSGHTRCLREPGACLLWRRPCHGRREAAAGNARPLRAEPASSRSADRHRSDEPDEHQRRECLMAAASRLSAQVGERWRAVDPLLPAPGLAVPDCGVKLVVTDPGGSTVAAGWCEHWAGAPGSLDLSWGAPRRFQLTAQVAGPDVACALDELL